jgi:hypothetical protein
VDWSVGDLTPDGGRATRWRLGTAMASRFRGISIMRVVGFAKFSVV